MVLFDIGANRGDATLAGLQMGYKVIACEPAPIIYKELVKNFIYSPDVIPLKIAVSDSVGTVEFYEAVEDGLSSLNKDWLTADDMPYKDKPFRTIKVNTTTIDLLAEKYGEPDLIKIDVEGAEWSVFKGMTKYHGKLAFEWTRETLQEHEKQIDYLKTLGYTTFGYQFIEEHLKEPKASTLTLTEWIEANENAWINGAWKVAGLRPTADVGMCWAS